MLAAVQCVGDPAIPHIVLQVPTPVLQCLARLLVLLAAYGHKVGPGVEEARLEAVSKVAHHQTDASVGGGALRCRHMPVGNGLAQRLLAKVGCSAALAQAFVV